MADERHDFSKDTAKRLCDRVAATCSNPDCGASTKGPHSGGEKAISVGMACQIHAASPGGPRYDANQTEEERRSIHNGMWLCRTCGTLIDTDEGRFSAPLLRAWKAAAELAAFKKIGKPAAAANAPSDGLPFSGAAYDALRGIGACYVQATFPEPQLWWFRPDSDRDDDPAYRELQALGLLVFKGPRGGPWHLTRAGVNWIMRNREALPPPPTEKE